MPVRALRILLVGFVGTFQTAGGEPIGLPDFLAAPRPDPTRIIQYGQAKSQAIDLFVPAGNGPHPVAILIHGGCWRDETGAGREQLRPMAKALADRGLAVWSIGYRRADETGGGYPGTFQDVAMAIDRLRLDARSVDIDLNKSVLVGHSAGGHLALWAAARRGLSHGSPLYRPDPFVPGAVVSLAGVGDLEDFAKHIPVTCGDGILERLTRGAAPAEISPAAMSAPDARVILITGVLDRVVPPYAAHDYAVSLTKRHGVHPKEIDLPDAGHLDLVSPGTPAWGRVLCEILIAAGVPP